MLKNRKRMIPKWGTKNKGKSIEEMKRERKKNREGKGRKGDKEGESEERRDGRWKTEMSFRGLVTLPG